MFTLRAPVGLAELKTNVAGNRVCERPVRRDRQQSWSLAENLHAVAVKRAGVRPLATYRTEDAVYEFSAEKWIWPGNERGAGPFVSARPGCRSIGVFATPRTFSGETVNV